MKASKQNFLVVPKSKAVGESDIFSQFMTILEKMPDVSIERVVGTQNSPKRLIIRCDQVSIQQLKSQFGEQLIIEPDSAIEMY